MLLVILGVFILYTFEKKHVFYTQLKYFNTFRGCVCLWLSNMTSMLYVVITLSLNNGTKFDDVLAK